MIKQQLIGGGIVDHRVLAIIHQLPRAAFVDETDPERIYGDHPLPIGLGQTISQPYIVALMSEKLLVNAHHRVLEIGTGSGYQTAILANLAREVYTVERIESLSELAKSKLESMDIHNVHYYVGDGTTGWPQHAPFDRVVVTAAAPRVPESLLQQLSDNGRLLIPVGKADRQELVAIERYGDRFTQDLICKCVFVKLIGKEAWEEE